MLGDLSNINILFGMFIAISFGLLGALMIIKIKQNNSSEFRLNLRLYVKF